MAGTERRRCVVCGAELVKRPGRGRWPRYCSPACRGAAKAAAARHRSAMHRRVRWPAVARDPRPCALCGADFEPAARGPVSPYCGRLCRRLHRMVARGLYSLEEARARRERMRAVTGRHGA